MSQLRAQVEQLRRQQKVGEGAGQGESARRESGLEEDWKMEVDEEVDSKKKLDEQRKRLQKQLREIEKFKDMDQMFKGFRKDLKSYKVYRIRRRSISRTPVRVIKRWQRSKMKSMKAKHVSWSWRRSRATVGWQQMIWKKKSGACKQGKKEEARLWSSSSPWERRMQDSRSKP